jgi:hypothetical protein
MAQRIAIYDNATTDVLAEKQWLTKHNQLIKFLYKQCLRGDFINTLTIVYAFLEHTV